MIYNEKKYLFELDSVRVNQYEINKAKEKLFIEILRGNIVIMTLNQMCSSFMFDLIDIGESEVEPKSRKELIELLKNKRIQLLRYNNLTVASYLCNNLSSNNPNFVISNPKLKFIDDKAVRNYLCEALENKKAISNYNEINLNITSEQKRILSDFIKTIVDISHNSVSYVDYKTNCKSLCEYLEEILSLFEKEKCCAEYVEISRMILKEMKEQCCIDNKYDLNKRSDYIRFTDSFVTKTCIDSKAIEFFFCALDYAYNFKNQDSIDDNLSNIEFCEENSSVIVEEIIDYCDTHYKNCCEKHKELSWGAASFFCINTAKKKSSVSWKMHVLLVILKNLLIKSIFIFICLGIAYFSNFLDGLLPYVISLAVGIAIDYSLTVLRINSLLDNITFVATLFYYTTVLIKSGERK